MPQAWAWTAPAPPIGARNTKASAQGKRAEALCSALRVAGGRGGRARHLNIACLFRETAFVSFSAPAVSPPFAADAHLLDCLRYRSLRLAGLLCLIADFVLPPATRGRSCLRPRLVRFFAFAIKLQAAATTSRSSKRSDVCCIHGAQWNIGPDRELKLELLLMGWSGRAPALPATDAGRGHRRQGARHVTEPRRFARRNRYRYRQELVPHRWHGPGARRISAPAGRDEGTAARHDGGSVFPAHANTGDPNGPVEACPLMRSHAR